MTHKGESARQLFSCFVKPNVSTRAGWAQWQQVYLNDYPNYYLMGEIRIVGS
jgi:hypothetical protein